jgi:hypothetical protein
MVARLMKIFEIKGIVICLVDVSRVILFSINLELKRKYDAIDE